MNKQYYIQNLETGLYYNNRGKYLGPYWGKSPRIFASSSGLKNSMTNELMWMSWHALNEEEKQQKLESVDMDQNDYSWIQDKQQRIELIQERRLYWAMRRHWETIKHKPIEELIAPPLVLHVLEFDE